MLGEGGAFHEPKQIELDEAVSCVLSLRHQLANLQVAVLEGASAREEIDNKRVAAQGKEVARTEAADSDHLEASVEPKRRHLVRNRVIVKSKEAEHGEYDNEGAESGPCHSQSFRPQRVVYVIDVSSMKQSVPYALSLRS